MHSDRGADEPFSTARPMRAFVSPSGGTGAGLVWPRFTNRMRAAYGCTVTVVGLLVTLSITEAKGFAPDPD